MCYNYSNSLNFQVKQGTSNRSVSDMTFDEKICDIVQQLLNYKATVEQKIIHEYNDKLKRCLTLSLESASLNRESSIILLSNTLNEKQKLLNNLNQTYQEYFEHLLNIYSIIIYCTKHNYNNSNSNSNSNTNTNTNSDKKTRTEDKKVKIKTKSEKYSFDCTNRGKQYRTLFNQLSEKLFTCKLCNYTTTHIGTIVKHVRGEHRKRAEKAKIDYKINRETDENFQYVVIGKIRSKRRKNDFGIKGHWQCRRCDRVLTSKSALIVHSNMHNGIKPYSCSICHQKLATQGILKRHMYRHTGEKPWQCHLCQRCFRHENTLKNHIRSHTGEKPYKCYFKNCTKAYGRRDSLKNHIRGAHSTQKSFVCQIKGCNKRYRNRTGLRHHMKIHNGTNKHKCDLCGKILSSKNGLSAHRRNIHKTYQHLPLECDVCGTRVSSEWGMKMHKAQAHEIHYYVDFHDKIFDK